MVTRGVVVHDPEDTLNVPANVADLLDILNRPIPDLQKAVKNWPSGLSCDAIEPWKRVINENSTMNKTLLEPQVLKVLMSNSVGIRDLVNIDDDHGPRHTRPVWHSLIRMLGSMCYKEAVFAVDVKFVRPKGWGTEKPESAAAQLVGLEASDTILSIDEVICEKPSASEHSACANEREVDAQTASSSHPRSRSTRTSGAETSGLYGEERNGSTDSREEDVNSADDDDDDDLDHSDDDLDHSDDNPEPRRVTIEEFAAQPPVFYDAFSNHVRYDYDTLFFADLQSESHQVEDNLPDAKFLDLPLDAHIFPGLRTWSSVYFPIICVADGENIFSLVASAAYQRRAWGIDFPVVGFELNKFSRFARLVVSWIDPAEPLPEKGNGYLPQIHILTPTGYVTASSRLGLCPQGLFDLADPSAMLVFAHFVLSLDTQFQALQSQLSSRRPSKLRWRADDDDEVTWSGSIEEWVRKLEIRDTTVTHYSGSDSDGSR